ncbi:hypothetical protein MMC15_007901 [Xylographa vitiligo]|nr:hypothetical protein [Xylographa vitiligo]
MVRRSVDDHLYPGYVRTLRYKGTKQKLFATAIFGVVKFVASTTCGLFLVDVICRKRSLSIGITLQAVSMCYIAAFLTIVPTIDEKAAFTSAQQHSFTGGIIMTYIKGFG